jgi:hypothetical protein
MKRWIGVSLLTLSLAVPEARAETTPVYGVIFTHVEDNTPGGTLGTSQSRQNYLTIRSNLIAMAALAESVGVQWTLQPDWKILEAALLYEDTALKATTNNKNFLVYLKEDRGAIIDPHSHENGGYNYTDVAHLLDSLGVGGTTVIGGHIWDPSLPQFQEWDRYRVPVAGEHYPGAVWRGDILIGSGTPNHVNDPIVSGVWRPRDRDHYFEDDLAANIVAIGQWKRSTATVSELIELYRKGTVPPSVMLTFSFNIAPSTIGSPAARQSVVDTMLAPLKAWSDSGLVVMTDFTSLIGTWQTDYASLGYLYQETSTTAVFEAPRVETLMTLLAPAPNPVRTSTLLRYALAGAAHVRLSIFDVSGRQVALLADGVQSAGDHSVRWDAGGVASGVYLCRAAIEGTGGSRVMKVLVSR